MACAALTERNRMDEQAPPRKAVVTGGGSGIGRACALLLAARGTDVAIVDVNGDAAEGVANEIRACGRTALALQCDVTDEGSVDTAFDSLSQHFGRLDAAINSAGVVGRAPQAAGEYDLEDFDRVVAINLRGMFLAMRRELVLMDKQGTGAIVNLSSGAGLLGVRHGAAYSASKHAVIGLTKSAALDYGRRGIRVNAVCPGVIDTRLSVGRMTADQVAGLLEATPNGALGQPEQVAEACVWLCGPASSHITGVALPVDGGYVAQ
jgi:NAD(P)-dependent dehydrogenase (short-subunit alcohol dehydrogenase family)